MKKRLLFMISLLCAVAQGMLAESHNIYYYELNASHQYTNTRMVNVAEGEGYTIIEPSDLPSDRVFKGWVAVTGAPGANDDDHLQDGETLILPGAHKEMGTTDLYYKARYISATNLSQINANLVLSDREVLTGTLAYNVQISIADGATVTLYNVNINGSGTWTTGSYAGLTCEGDATIILEGTNIVKGFYEGYPGIKVPTSHLLTIEGDGSLNASSNGKGAGIGAGYESSNHINNSCGSIVIQGGTIVAEGGGNCPGIGAGGDGSSGNITITSSVNSVTATGGNTASRCIGGKDGYTDSGTVTIGNVAMASAIERNSYTYIPLANAADNSAKITAFNNHVCDVTLKDRTLYKDGAWNTLCLPFDVTLAESPLADGTVKVLNTATTKFDSQSDKLTLSFQNAGSIIAAGTPFIVKWTSGSDISEPLFANVTVTNVATHEASFSGGSFVGCFSPVALTANDQTTYYFGSGNMLYYPNADISIKSFRAYFSLPGASSAPDIVMNYDGDDVTGIEEVKGVNDNGWYSLDGLKIQISDITSQTSNLKKGVYIVNGKKVVIH